MKKIILYPHKILKRVSEPIDFEKDDVKFLIEQLKSTLSLTKNGVGLAGCQIGYPKRIFYVKTEDFEKIFINPEIVNTSNKISYMDEGCLSLPGLYGKVPRFKKVIVKAFDENKKKFKLKTKGFLAQIIQHEIDHLNGILFIEKATKIEKQE